MKKVRQSNFELMRLISMFFIVIWHIILHGNIFEKVTLTSQIITCIVFVHVNSLVFLTGYFNIQKKEIECKKNLLLIGKVWFYKVLFLCIFLLFSITTISKTTIFEELLPVDLNNYWFINYYIVLSILSPYLNKVIEKMPKKDFSKFIIIIFLLLSVIPALSNERIISNGGYSLMNFIIMYFLGAYFRKYPLKENYYFKNKSKRKIKCILVFSYLAIIVIRISIYYLGEKLFSINNSLLQLIGNMLKDDFFKYSSPLVIIETCIYCLIFESMNFKSKIVNFCSKSTLGIYLIHDNKLVRSKIYEFLIANNKSSLGNVYLLFIIAIIIYLGSFLIDILRRILLKLLKIIYTRYINKKKQII